MDGDELRTVGCVGMLRMSRLASDQYAILELVAIQPVAEFPKRHGPAIRRLARTGLIVRREECWYPTAKGLELAGYTLH
jgi:hypothetical protein